MSIDIMTEFELLYRSTLDFSMTNEEKDRFKTKLKDIVLSSFKIFSDNANLKIIFLQKKLTRLKLS